MKKQNLFLLAVFSLLLTQCKTKSDVRKEQEIERLRSELHDVKSDRATDSDNTAEEFKVEVGKLNNLVEERAIQHKRQMDELRDDIKQIEQRMVGLEQKLNSLTPNPDTLERARAAEEEKPERVEKSRNSFEGGRRLFEDGKYEEASEMFHAVSKKSRGEEQKKSVYWAAESLFHNKDYADAAIEFGEFRKNYPKDALVPQAIYRQASSFKKLGKQKEAKLFFQEVVEKFPRSAFANKAKQELRRTK